MKIFHFNIPSPAGNFGDDVLFLSTKKAFEKIFKRHKIEWIDYPLRNHTTDNVIKRANTCDLIVVGGGGLLLKDTAKNSWSGWQWACSIEHLKKIEKPLIIYAIGYNRFREQEEFDPVFFDHIKETVEKAAFFSVRNTGSKEALLKYGLPGDKIHINPCPSLFCPTVSSLKKDSVHIGINLAGDRDNLRYERDKFYGQMEIIFNELIKDNFTLNFFNHNWNPSSNCQDLIDKVIKKKIFNIETVWNENDIYNTLWYYNSMDMIVAMRAHAQLVPFGQHKKVLSIISHNKNRWFLRDAEMEDTGIDISDRDFTNKFLDKMRKILEDDIYYERQQKALNKFKEIQNKNGEIIRSLID